MKNKHIVLYVPGLGDQRLNGRRLLTGLWHYRNLQIEVCAKEWRVNHTWDYKLRRLLDRIDTYYDQGYVVSLVGESAGATAVIQALKQRHDKINAVVLLCGKSQYPHRVATRLYNQNPALRDAMYGSSEAIATLTAADRAKILNLHPLFDPIVPVWETKIPGVKNAIMPSIGHATSIVFGMSIWSPRLVYFIRKRAKLTTKEGPNQ